MLFRALLLALLPAVVLSEIRLNQTDIPQQCRSICQPVTNLTQTCNVSNSTGTATMSNRTQDLLERQCVCTNESFDVANRTSLCAGCIDQTANNSTGSSNSTGQMGKCSTFLGPKKKKERRVLTGYQKSAAS